MLPLLASSSARPQAAALRDPTVPAYARYGPQLTWVQMFASVKMKVQKTTDVSNRNDSQNITYLGCFDIWSGRTLQGSFSAVSTPMFAPKYSEIFICSHFSRSLRFIYFCNAHISKFHQKLVLIFPRMTYIEMMF